MPKDEKNTQNKNRNHDKTLPSPYVCSVLQLYTDLPHTPRRPSRDDRFVAHRLQLQKIPLLRVRAALLLGSARRLCRDNPAEHLLPIRSIRYFLPVVEELKFAHLDTDYIVYLDHKLSGFIGRKVSPVPTGDVDRRSQVSPKKRSSKQLRLPW